MKKKPLVSPIARPTEGRALTPNPKGERGYPSLGAVHPEHLRAAARLFLASGLLAAAGCNPPVCSTSRVGEMKSHASQAVSEAVGLNPVDAVEQLLVGTGITPHPFGGAMAGEAPMVTPVVPPGSSGTAE